MLLNHLRLYYYQYDCRVDEFEEDKRNSSYKISLISPKATIYLTSENFKIVTTDNQTRINLTKILIEQLTNFVKD